MRRCARRYWHEPRGLALSLLALAFFVWRVSSHGGERDPIPDRIEEGVHEVRRVIDGDTIVLVSGARVRLQGIDTPETVQEGRPVEPWGPQASQFTRQFVKNANRKVRLTFSNERKDRHDRFLAFVWNGDIMLNEELVRAGLAHARLDYRYSGPMKRRFHKAQGEAQRAARGLWSGEQANSPVFRAAM